MQIKESMATQRKALSINLLICLSIVLTMVLSYNWASKEKSIPNQHLVYNEQLSTYLNELYSSQITQWTESSLQKVWINPYGFWCTNLITTCKLPIEVLLFSPNMMLYFDQDGLQVFLPLDYQNTETFDDAKLRFGIILNSMIPRKLHRCWNLMVAGTKLA